MTVDRLDLTDPTLYLEGDGLQALRRLRAEQPIYWNETRQGPPFWALTRYRDAKAMFDAGSALTSVKGMTVGQSEAAAQAAANKMLIVADGAFHDELRAILRPSFSPAALQRLEPRLRRCVARTLARAQDLDTFDAVSDLAAGIPLQAICALLDIPPADMDFVLALTRTAFGSTTGSVPITAAERMQANAEIFDYFAWLLGERRSEPGEDVISSLVSARLDGRPLTDEVILLNLNGLITGGNETTRHAAAGAIIAFARFPDQLDLLRANPRWVSSAVEEVLRWTAPSLNVMRTAVRHVQVGDCHLKAGQRVSAWLPIVNRDPEQFDDPERFDISRRPNRQMTFGHAGHHCIGAPLARLELRILLQEIANSVRHIEIVGPIRRLRSTLMWGVDSVPACITLNDHHPTQIGRDPA